MTRDSTFKDSGSSMSKMEQDNSIIFENDVSVDFNETTHKPLIEV